MEASARKKKRPLAAIPENLEELSKPELIKIIESLRQQVQKKQRTDAEVDAKAVALMNNLHPKSDTARMTRLVLTGNDVSRFFGIELLVHPGFASASGREEAPCDYAAAGYHIRRHSEREGAWL